MCKVLVIIPCFNEEENIKKVINNIQLNSILNNSITSDFFIECLVINDCSTDSTLKVCQENGYNYLNLPVNLGIGGSVQSGYLYALEHGYDIAIQHDGDGQHDPFYFKDVINPIITGQADIVIGSRFLLPKGFQSTKLRRFGISIISKLIYLCTKIKVHDVTSGYRAVNRKYIELFSSRYDQDYPEPEAIVNALLNKAKIKEVPVVMHERKSGKSSISSLRSFYYMIKVSLTIILYRILFVRKD